MMEYHASAKVNIFLKIVGTRGSYHELLSRFMIVPSVYDTVSFLPKKTREPFELVGNFSCELEQNTLFKIAEVLKSHGFENEVDRVMQEYALHVKKRIPQGAGLGGGSSDAATFLKMLNDVANLKLSIKEMMEIGSHVGADVPFFVSGYSSANVSGIGERVECFEEATLDLEVMTPPISCNTALVYQYYRKYFLQSIHDDRALEMVELNSLELLKTFSKERLNDLYLACVKAYPDLIHYEEEGWFFSGSGSSFFRMRA